MHCQPLPAANYMGRQMCYPFPCDFCGFLELRASHRRERTSYLLVDV